MTAAMVATAPGPTRADPRTALSKEALKRAFLDNLFYYQGKFPALATRNDYYMALAYTVRDRLLQRWISTAETYTEDPSRTVASAAWPPVSWIRWRPWRSPRSATASATSSASSPRTSSTANRSS